MPEDRRQDILDAAFIAFAEKGFEKTNMEDVALEAGVSKGTLYLYFKSKNALFLALYTQMVTRFTNSIHAASVSPQPAPDRLRQALNVLGVILQDAPTWAKLLPELTVHGFNSEHIFEMSKTLNAESINAVKTIIADGIAAGDFAETDAHTAAIAIESAAAGIVSRVIMYPEWNLTDVLQFFIELTLKGLSKGANYEQ